MPKQCQSGVAGIAGLLVSKHMLQGSLFLVPLLRVVQQFSQPLHTSKFSITNLVSHNLPKLTKAGSTRANFP